MQSSLILACVCVLVAQDDLTQTLRVWTDITGENTWNARLFSADEDSVLLRTEDGNLHELPLTRLSKTDQLLVTRHLLAMKPDAAPGDPTTMQVWTANDGLSFRGRVLEYVRVPLKVQWKRRDVYVNDSKLSEVDSFYRRMLPAIIEHVDGQTLTTDQEITKWASRFRNGGRIIEIDGALMRLENGDEYVVPLFLMSEDQRTVLEDGWDEWKNQQLAEAQRRQESLRLQREEAERQREEAEDRARELAVRQWELELRAIEAGATDLWEVRLAPRLNTRGTIDVLVTGNDHQVAQAKALQRYPGYVPVSIRQINDTYRWSWRNRYLVLP